MVLQVQWTRGGGEWEYGDASAYIRGAVLAVLRGFRATWRLESCNHVRCRDPFGLAGDKVDA